MVFPYGIFYNVLEKINEPESFWLFLYCDGALLLSSACRITIVFGDLDVLSYCIGVRRAAARF